MSEKAVVLIVDDVRVNLQTLAHILKNEYTIKIAQGGRQAVELASQEPIPDLILLDVGMPDVGGYEVCRLLREDSVTANIPVIFVTGKDTVEDEEYGLSLGAVDYITKPIHPSIVKARVKTHITLKQQHDLLTSMAMRDQLTQLYNRHYFTDMFMSKISHAVRHNKPLSIMMVDIDHFKSINDTYGHLVGDSVLKSIAHVMAQNARTEDIAARFGGEEFILVLDNCTLEDALQKAEHLREQIQTLRPEGIDVTGSFGVVQLDDTINTATRMLDSVDKALYKAKKEGRNRVKIYQEY